MNNVKEISEVEFAFKQKGDSYVLIGIKGGDELVELKIPPTYRGKPVTSIDIDGNVAMRFPKLKRLFIPSNISRICKDAWSFFSFPVLEAIEVDGDNAFYDSRDNCNAIIEKDSNKLILGCKNTYIPKTVISIGNSAFNECVDLESIDIPSGVTSIASWSFAYCSSLKSVSFPNDLAVIGNAAFIGCSSLKSVYIPSKVDTIGSLAFALCESLSSINVAKDNKTYDSRNGCNAIIDSKKDTLLFGCGKSIIPTGINSIATNAFYGSSLLSLVIPQGVKTIFPTAFAYCRNLKDVIISSSVTSIRCLAFEGCSSLSRFFYDGSSEMFEKINIDETPGANIDIDKLYFYSERKPAETGRFWHYVDQKPTIW